MNVRINGAAHVLPDDAKLADALDALAPTPPFAVSVNREFVPRAAYAQRALRDDDDIEVIRPVTGG